jgi:hypothetical protein
VNESRERGSVITLVALLMLSIVILAAIVVDLGYTRSDRRDARRVADAAATSGALGLSDRTDGRGACSDALFYAYENLDEHQPTSAELNAACAPLAGACNPSVPRVATLTIGDTQVQVTNPVLDGDQLMDASALGSRVSQTIQPDIDGTPCDRLAVSITRAQAHIFGSVGGGGRRMYAVHSVARYNRTKGGATVRPAVVALNQTRCRAIDTGSNGTIVVVATASGPGTAMSDSDGSAGSCSGSNAILSSASSGRMIAESSGSAPGQLSWYLAPTTKGYNNGASINTTVPASYPSATGNYVGQLGARSDRVTRTPADVTYHCRNVATTVQPLCATADDPTQQVSDLAAGSPPPGFTVWTGPCDTTKSNVNFSGKVWLRDCPVFTVKGGTATVAAGSMVMFNALSVEANGKLYVNSTGSVAGDGLPLATSPGVGTTLILKSLGATAFNVQSTSAVVSVAETTVYSAGGFSIQGSATARWSAPATGLTEGLLYWSESPQPFNIQGGPTLDARGIVFQGNGQLTGGGGGTIDLTKVQMWVDSIALSGSTTVKLAPDPSNSIGTPGSSSVLIR